MAAFIIAKINTSDIYKRTDRSFIKFYISLLLSAELKFMEKNSIMNEFIKPVFLT